MDAETKMNVANALIWVSVITCALAIAAIIATICMANDICSKEMQTDIQIDVLAILVTVLIGWNIWTVIDVKQEMQRQQEETRKIEKQLNEKITNQFGPLNKQVLVSLVTINYHAYLNFRGRKEYAGAITSLVLAIKFMIINIEDEKENLLKCCNTLRTYLNETRGKFQYGENNMEILKRNIIEIQSNKNYEQIKEELENPIFVILADISSEMNLYP